MRHIWDLMDAGRYDNRSNSDCPLTARVFFFIDPQSYLNKNADYIATLNSKARKGLTSSQYPNPPSSLHSVFLHVLYHVNKGRGKRGEALLTQEEFAKITTDNANRFFGFNLEL
jgi:hypothetical protein